MRALTVEINEVAGAFEDKGIKFGVFVIVEGLNDEIHVRRDRQSGPVEAHGHSLPAPFYAADVVGNIAQTVGRVGLNGLRRPDVPGGVPGGDSPLRP